MKHKIFLMLAAALLVSCILMAQVQVSEEPLHKKVLENKYIRLLDVWLQPGDTSLFHIHSTASVFLYFSSNTIASQVKDGAWVKEKTVAGKSWYRSFSPDTLVHRVCNTDSFPFHVTDVEIISSYKPSDQLQALPFAVLYENEKVFAYRLSDSLLPNKIISNRGPMVAELLSGNSMYYVDALTKQQTAIRPGGYLYIEPGSTFYFNTHGKVNMVLFEIK